MKLVHNLRIELAVQDREPASLGSAASEFLSPTCCALRRGRLHLQQMVGNSVHAVQTYSPAVGAIFHAAAPAVWGQWLVSTVQPF